MLYAEKIYSFFKRTLKYIIVIFAIYYFKSEFYNETDNNIMAANLIKIDPKTLSVGIIGYTGNCLNAKIINKI